MIFGACSATVYTLRMSSKSQTSKLRVRALILSLRRSSAKALADALVLPISVLVVCKEALVDVDGRTELIMELVSLFTVAVLLISPTLSCVRERLIDSEVVSSDFTALRI